MKKYYFRELILGSMILVFSSNGIAEIKPYIEGQMNYVNPDNVSTATYSGTVSGITFNGVKMDEEYDNDTTAGFEIGLNGVAQNIRLGFSYMEPEFKLDKATLTGSITDGVTTLSGSVGLTSADFASVGVTVDNDVKVYMLNAYYDFDASEKLKPFIGFGLGMSDIENAEDKELTYAAMAGAKYYIQKNVYLGGKFTYATINGPKDKLGVDYEDIDFYTATVALGYEF